MLLFLERRKKIPGVLNPKKNNREILEIAV